ncbi:MAG: arsinothricin resistance N-acetyltransferase ArsN1 family B [Vicinamibacterales bacterium]
MTTGTITDGAVRDATDADAGAVVRIYNPFITGTVVTFEEVPIDAVEMRRRMADVRDASLPWLVIEEMGQVAGYAYATRWRVRRAYRYAVEITIYLAPGHEGRGLGTRLYGALFDRLRAAGIHAVIGGIALPNAASVALHEKMGLRKVAHFEQVGFKFGRWIDVGYWETLLAGGPDGPVDKEQA